MFWKDGANLFMNPEMAVKESNEEISFIGQVM